MIQSGTSFTMHWSGVDDFRQRLGSISRNLVPTIRRFVAPVCQLVLDDYAQALEVGGYVATGALTSGIKSSGVRIDERDGIVSFGFGDPIDGPEGYGNIWGYAKVIEYGASFSKMPPMDIIMNWMTMKNISQQYDGQTFKQAAFAIARSIQLNGLQPRHLFEDSYSKHVPDIQEAMENAIQAVLEQN